jgi:hypothetical protein
VFTHYTNKRLAFPKIKREKPGKKKAPGGRLAGTARRGCGGWEIEVINVNKFPIGRNTKFRWFE